MTKCFFGVDGSGEQRSIAGFHKQDTPEWVNQGGLSRKHIFDAVDASVTRLGTYIDVLQIHRLDRSVPREEIMKALNDVVKSGKVRYIGASSVRLSISCFHLIACYLGRRATDHTPTIQMAAWEFQALQNVASRNGWHQFISMQNYYNLIGREEEREMIPYCLETGVGIIPWSPLARGMLARPWNSRSTIRETSDRTLTRFFRARETDIDKAIVDRVAEVAGKKGLSMAQVAMAWNLSKEGVNPILGLTSKERIDEAVATVGVKLTKEEIDYLEALYVPKEVVPLMER